MNVDNLSLTVAEALLRTQTPGRASGGAEHNRGTHCAIAISREVGAQGETAAREIGRRLGCPVYDREIVERIAAELRRTPEQLQHVDERSASWLEEWLGGLFHEPVISTDTYARYLAAALRGMAEIGPCVVVGRAAARILPADTTLRVRFVADHADRVRVIRERLRLTEHDAVAWMKRTEHERAEFVRKHFGVEAADPRLYDLVLNTSRVPIEEAAGIVVHAFGLLLNRVGHKALHAIA